MATKKPLRLDLGRITISGKYLKFMEFCNSQEDPSYPDTPAWPPDFGLCAALALARFEERLFEDEQMAKMFIVTKPGDNADDWCVVTQYPNPEELKRATNTAMRTPAPLRGVGSWLSDPSGCTKVDAPAWTAWRPGNRGCTRPGSP